MEIGSFASYTKTKSVESAVGCLLTLDDDDVEQAVVNRYWRIAVTQVTCSGYFSYNRIEIVPYHGGGRRK
jgi:hypothetical protein